MDEHQVAEDQMIPIIFEMVHNLRKALSREIEAEDLGIVLTSLGIIRIISRRNGCTPAYIAQCLGRDKGQITRLTKVLLDKKWLDKAAHPDDKRSQILNITAEGEVINQRILQVEARVIQTMTAGFSSDEVTLLMKLMNRCGENLWTES